MKIIPLADRVVIKTVEVEETFNFYNNYFSCSNNGIKFLGNECWITISR